MIFNSSKTQPKRREKNRKKNKKEEEPKNGLSSLKMNLKQIYSQNNQPKYQLYSPQAFLAPAFNYQQYGQYPVTPQAYVNKQNIGMGVINYQDLYNKRDENTNYLNVKSDGYKY